MGSVYFDSLAVAVTPPFNPVSLNKIMFWLNKKCSLVSVSLCVSDIKKKGRSADSFPCFASAHPL